METDIRKDCGEAEAGNSPGALSLLAPYCTGLVTLPFGDLPTPFHFLTLSCLQGRGWRHHQLTCIFDTLKLTCIVDTLNAAACERAGETAASACAAPKLARVEQKLPHLHASA